jgi:pyroglutamyl-peptidase
VTQVRGKRSPQPAAPVAASAPAHVLIAAFGPFGGRKRNRAHDAVRLLVGEEVDGTPLEIAELPTVFAALPETIARLLQRSPKLLLLVGESASARTLLVERLAINVAHARIADNAGMRPIDEEVVRGGELARRVRFDPRMAANASLAAGVPCEVSSHAGTFCCNAALYHALGQAAAHPSKPRVAFVHVPARLPWARDHRTARGLLAVAKSLVGSAQLAYPAGS